MTADASPFRYCFNTSTVRGQKLPLDQVARLAAEAGYQGIEPWIDEINRYTQAGGRLDDLRKLLADLGLKVESAIGFAEWIVDDDARRAKGLEVAKRDMDLVARIGGARIAAPPSGATDQTDLNLFRAAERYRTLLELGQSMGVVPQVELWGFSKSLCRLGEVVFVATESAHPDACILADVYHVYKGGSDLLGLRMINGQAMHNFHMNDYPADPPRATIKDEHRVYPGDGVAPLGAILRMLRDTGYRGALSLELFNPAYYQQEASFVAKTGIAKMKAAVEKALSG